MKNAEMKQTAFDNIDIITNSTPGFPNSFIFSGIDGKTGLDISYEYREKSGRIQFEIGDALSAGDVKWVIGDDVDSKAEGDYDLGFSTSGKVFTFDDLYNAEMDGSEEYFFLNNSELMWDKEIQRFTQRKQ